jgi:hypothetical protein
MLDDRRECEQQLTLGYQQVALCLRWHQIAEGCTKESRCLIDEM